MKLFENVKLLCADLTFTPLQQTFAFNTNNKTVYALLFVACYDFFDSVFIYTWSSTGTMQPMGHNATHAAVPLFANMVVNGQHANHAAVPIFIKTLKLLCFDEAAPSII